MAEEAAAAPVTASPEASPPVVPAAAAPEVSVTAPVAETPVSETAVVTPSPEGAVSEPVAETKPLLSPETPEAKPAEPVAEAPKVEVEPAPLPVYEFKLPEGSKTDNPIFKSFNTKLGEFQNLSKTEQAAVNKFGQEMIDLHLEDVKAVVENQNKASWDWFKNRNAEWLESAKKDPSIGGDNFDKTVSDATQAISLYAGTKAQQLEFAKLLHETGLENHPAMLRFASNITKIAAKEGQPVAGSNAPMKSSGSIAHAMYGGTSKAS